MITKININTSAHLIPLFKYTTLSVGTNLSLLFIMPSFHKKGRLHLPLSTDTSIYYGITYFPINKEQFVLLVLYLIT